MKNKNCAIADFILREVGIKISPTLNSMIMNPQKLNALNSATLEKIVTEYAPVYKKFKCVLDGSDEIQTLSIFSLSLMLRLTNKPELLEIINK